MKKILESRVAFFFYAYLILILNFVVQKPVFMLYHWGQSSQFSAKEWLEVIWAGFSMDMTVAGYLMAIPAIILLLSVFFEKGLKSVLYFWFALVSILVSLIFIPDLELYTFWGFRIDATVFTYLTDPKLAMASQSAWRSGMFFFITLLYGLGMYFVFLKLIIKKFPTEKPKKKWLTFAMLFLLTGLLFIPIRGGITTSTMNPGRAFFSDKMFLNHAALNPIFNMLYSLSKTNDLSDKYQYMEADSARSIFDNMTVINDSVQTQKVLNTDRPDIVFIMLESFGRGIIEPLGGEKGVAPNLNKLVSEGILFSQMYANSFRTDRGLVSVLAGYPSHPTVSILKYAKKTQALNSIPKSLIDNGYNASFLYGGDLDFAQMKLFIVSQKVSNTTADVDFPIAQRLTKWGVPDEFTFPHLQKEIEEDQKSPSLKIFLTLSSHEPFEVPTQKFSDPYLNSIAYADSCLGVFIENLRKSPRWANTLVVLVPDHDARYPENVEYNLPQRHDIFMLWLGGAVEKPLVIEKYCSQMDIAATLLSQLNIPYRNDFPFSKDVLNPSSKGFAFYTFPDGFGLLTDKGETVFDNANAKSVMSKGSAADTLQLQGKAFLQMFSKDFQNK